MLTISSFATILVLLTFLLLLPAPIEAYPSYLTCSSTLTIGTSMMQRNIKASSGRTVTFHRTSESGPEITCGDTYSPGETLYVSLSSGDSAEWAWELGGGAEFVFSGSTCSKTRINHDSSNQAITTPASGDITLLAAYAVNSDRRQVYVTPTCTLSAEIAPSASPSISNAPTISAAPTTETAYPTSAPTSDTSAPTAATPAFFSGWSRTVNYAKCGTEPDSALSPQFSSDGARLLTIILPTILVAFLCGFAAFNFGIYRPAMGVLALWFLLLSFLTSDVCMNWATTADYTIAGLFLVVLTLFWSQPEFLKPGGILEALMFQRVVNVSQGKVSASSSKVIDWTIGQMVLILLFVAWCAVAVIERYDFYTTDDVYTGTQAFGKAIAHAAIRCSFFAEASGHRFSVVWGVFGMPYDRMIFFHKMAGRYAFLFVILHAAFTFAGKEDGPQPPGHSLGDSISLNRVNASFGLVAFVMFLGLIGTSYEKMRREKFEDFYFYHFNFKFMMLVSMVIHNRVWIFPFSFLLVVSFQLDMAIRFISKVIYKAELKSAELIVDDPKTKTRIAKLVIERDVWPGGVFRHDAGDYVLLSFGSKDSKKQPINKYIKDYVPPGAPTGNAAFWFHPYTISSPPTYGKSNQFTVMIKSMGEGTWSDQVCDMCKEGSDLDVSLVNPHVGGPMGRLSIEPEDYHTVVLCTGGIGVTPMCSIWSDLALKMKSGKTKVKKVVLLWSAPSTKVFSAFNEWLALTEGNENISVALFATRESQEEQSDVSGKPKILFGMRPNWEEEINKVCNACPSGEYVGAFSCGPAPLMLQVKAACYKRKYIHLHEETFEW